MVYFNHTAWSNELNILNPNNCTQYFLKTNISCPLHKFNPPILTVLSCLYMLTFWA